MMTNAQAALQAAATVATHPGTMLHNDEAILELSDGFLTWLNEQDETAAQTERPFGLWPPAAPPTQDGH